MRLLAIGAATALMLGGAAHAQSDHDGTHHDLGGSMGTQSSATPRSHSASMASGAHQTPVAKAGRHHSTARAGKMKSAGAGSAVRSGDMTPSQNPDANQQH